MTQVWFATLLVEAAGQTELACTFLPLQRCRTILVAFASQHSRTVGKAQCGAWVAANGQLFI
jgi:hypothetical protein